MKATKKIIAVVLCLLMLFPCVQIISFAEPVSTMNNNIFSEQCSLEISGINSTSNASMQSARSMSLSIKMELQKIKSGTYTTIETWTASKTGTLLTLTETRLINILATYRLKVTFKAGNETIVRYAYPG